MEKEGEELFNDVNFDINQDTDQGIEESELANEEVAAEAKPDSNEDDDGKIENNDDNNDDNTEAKPEEGIEASEFEQEDSAPEPGAEDNTSVDDDTSADNSSSPLQLLTTTLQAEGVIDIPDGEKIESSKQILDAVRRKIEENEFADLNDTQKDYVKALRAGIPEEEVKQNLNNIKALEGINDAGIEADENLRRILITENLIADGLSPEKAARSVQRIVEAGDDVEEAKDAHRSLKETEGVRIQNETKRLEAEKKEENEKTSERLAALKTTVLEKEEFIPGHKPNSATKEKIYSNMTKVVGHDKKGNPLNALNAARHKDPEAMEMLENYLFTVTKGFTDWSSFKNKVKSNAIKDLDNKLRNTQSGGGASRSVSKESKTGLAGALANLDIK